MKTLLVLTLFLSIIGIAVAVAEDSVFKAGDEEIILSDMPFK